MSDYGYPGGELALFSGARNWKRYLAQQLGPFIAGDVLEVGAGIGSTTRALHSSRCASWTCLEPDGGLAAQLTGAVAALQDREGRPPHTLVGTLDTLDPAKRYDTLLYIDVLEHIADDRRELQLASARLRPGGALLVLSPAHDWLYTEFDRAIGHERRYDRASLQALSPARTDLVCLRYLDCVGVLASLGNRLLMRRSMPTAAQVSVWDRLMVPLSRYVDTWFGYRLGKSVLAVWRRAR